MKNRIFALIICLIMLTCGSYVAGATQVWSFEEEHEFLISSIKDEPIVFSPEFIEKHISVAQGDLTGITVTSLPKPNEGLLVMGTELVKEYQRLPREEISRIKFIPVYGSDMASFTFIPESEESIKTTIVINLMEEPNNPPVSIDSTFTTIKDLAITGNIPVNDPENDIITIRLIGYPQKGTVTFEGTKFVYTPYEGKTGTDAFIYYAQDSFGNLSQEHTVTVEIEKAKNVSTLSDMSSNAYHYSAIKSEQVGILSGERIGSAKLFYPDKAITKSEFLVMLTAASRNENDLTVCVNTGLSNDSNLKMWIKPYVNLGIEKQIIDDSYFDGDETLTRAQAVEMVSAAMNKQDVKNETIFIKDIGAIPNTSLQSYINLQSENMLNLYDGNAYPNAVLTRDYAADLLYSLYKYQISQ